MDMNVTVLTTGFWPTYKVRLEGARVGYRARDGGAAALLRGGVASTLHTERCLQRCLALRLTPAPSLIALPRPAPMACSNWRWGCQTS